MVTASSAGCPHNLPTQLTSLVGREREVAAVVELLLSDDVRLLTLTGPGGVGKTRLAIAAAEVVASEFADGLWFIALAPLSDPKLVLPTIAQRLGILEAGEEPLEAQVRAILRDKHLLLVLDNFEQVIEAAPVMSDLLTTCPRLTILTTSRAILHLSGEHAVAVGPLALPKADDSAETVVKAEAVRLFVQRARAMDSGFDLNEANAAAVAAICHRVDGLPLALELAAARSRHLPPAALLPRLARRLPLLTGGPRDAPARLRTMRDAIAWSHDLLSPAEQVLFRRLSVFAGGFTLEAADAVCVDIVVLDVAASLVDKSLLQRLEPRSNSIRSSNDDFRFATLSPRFSMLETVREYARERLDASGEEWDVRRAHSSFFLNLAEQAAFVLADRREEAEGLDQLDEEHDNLRAALSWLSEAGDAEALPRFAVALARFWHVRGYLSEGRDWLERALVMGVDLPIPVRAEVLAILGDYARDLGDYARARALYEEVLALQRASGERPGVASALSRLGALTDDQGNDVMVRSFVEESLEIQRESGDRHGMARSLHTLGWAVNGLGDSVRAQSLFSESLAIWKAMGNREGVAHALSSLGNLAAERNDTPAAWSFFAESLEIYRTMGHRAGTTETLADLGWLSIARADHASARALFAESLTTHRLAGRRRDAVGVLEGCAALAAAEDQPEYALRLASAAAALREAMGLPSAAVRQPRLSPWLDHARRIGGEQAAAAWSAGQTLSVEQAIAEAIALVQQSTGSLVKKSPGQDPDHGLSAREREVLRLLIEGRSDRAIGDALFISRRTASKHVGSIIAKLGVASRTEAVAHAMRDRLA